MVCMIGMAGLLAARAPQRIGLNTESRGGWLIKDVDQFERMAIWIPEVD